MAASLTLAQRASRAFSSPSSRQSIIYGAASLVASIPIFVLVNDCTFSLCRVNGSSMEPTLQSGDVVLVRRMDWLPWKQLSQPESGHAENNDDDDATIDNLRAKRKEINRWRERQELMKWEARHCQKPESVPLVYQSPPAPLTGDIVVYQDPEIYPPKWNIKRVIGLGGQMVKFPMELPESIRDSLTSEERKQYQSMLLSSKSVSPYSIWVEGDNPSNSQDSRQSGDVSKNLLIGVAEYIVWPPTRVGTIPSRPNGSDVTFDGMVHDSPRSYWR